MLRQSILSPVVEERAMAKPSESSEPSVVQSFELESQARHVGIVRELVDFLLCNKKWWLIPIVAVLLLLGAVLILGGTAAAPFIYTLF
jgi:hypothetical protein